MTIELPPDIETRLKGEAIKQGIAAEAYASKLIAEHFPAENPAQPMLDLFAEWAKEDGTDDPEEIERRNQEVEEFKAAMNRNRLDMEGPNSRPVYP